MDISNPRVSVVMGTLNRADLIERAIESIFQQSFKNLEVIIVDDGSTDNTEEVVKRLPRIRYFKNRINRGLPYSLNRGIKKARGEYIARLDDDDYWCHPDKLKLQVDFLDSHLDYVVVGGGMIVVDENDQERWRYLKREKNEDIKKRALWANPFSHTTTMFRRDKVIEAGLYDDIRYIEDWNLWLKLGRMGKFYNFPSYFTRYLMAGQNVSFLHQAERRKGFLKIIKLHHQYYSGFPWVYGLVGGEYLYSIFPSYLKKFVHPILTRIKRSF